MMSLREDPSDLSSGLSTVAPRFAGRRWKSRYRGTKEEVSRPGTKADKGPAQRQTIFTTETPASPRGERGERSSQRRQGNRIGRLRVSRPSNSSHHNDTTSTTRASFKVPGFKVPKSGLVTCNSVTLQLSSALQLATLQPSFIRSSFLVSRSSVEP